jgi:hypothetical protein
MTGTRVTAVETDGPGEPESVEIVDDYVIITDGTARLDHIQVHANGTHVITVKGVRR